MYELPFMRAITRQARPKVVFGQLNPGKGIGHNALVGPAALMGPGRHFAGGGEVDADALSLPEDSSYGIQNGGSGAMDNILAAITPTAASGANPDGSISVAPSNWGSTSQTTPTGIGGWLQSKHGGVDFT